MIIAGIALVAVLAAESSVAASATSPVRISRIYYNPPGRDTQANSRLVQKRVAVWIALRNHADHSEFSE